MEVFDSAVRRGKGIKICGESNLKVYKGNY